jgi:hypothetical protein
MREGFFGECCTTLLPWHRLPTVFAEDSANAGESARSLLQRVEFSKLTDGFMFAL